MSATLTEVRRTPPDGSEHAPYYGTYITQVRQGDVVEALRSQLADTRKWLAGLSESQAGHRYAPDKWSVRQVLGHLIDAERIFVYRATCFARGETTSLPGFDENAYVANASFDARSLTSLATEFCALREATIAFYDALTADEWRRGGAANGKGVTVRALAWIIAGHEVHHRRILKERYGL